MILPPENQLAFAGFGYGIGDEEVMTPQGKVKIKVLAFRDNPSGMTLGFKFTEEEFEAFRAKLNENRIVAATSIPSGLIKPA